MNIFKTTNKKQNFLTNTKLLENFLKEKIELQTRKEKEQIKIFKEILSQEEITEENEEKFLNNVCFCMEKREAMLIKIKQWNLCLELLKKMTNKGE